MVYIKHPLSRVLISCLFLAASAESAFALKVNDKALPADIWHITIMPGETVNLDHDGLGKILIDGQRVAGEWTAPLQSGTHSLTVETSDGGSDVNVTVFVLTPSSAINEKGYIGKYRIGHYPRNTPKGFIKLNKNEVDLAVSPFFKVGQFLCKQQPKVWPKYLVISSQNIERLEALLSDLNEKRDTDADTLFVMSGYRTPFYNAAIGSAKFSRHMYGDAADVYVDTKPRNGNMDDLNRDGKITKADADFLYDYAQKLFRDRNLVEGGLGSYKANSVHGPFVHIDARGRPARWGR